ncbi:MAG: sulfatase-like hydrolase/transferase [Verrucomicrobia bacterium]|nr:sulfatase-like hydrolase/transferase [Verrucomicrobiota bacterium]
MKTKQLFSPGLMLASVLASLASAAVDSASIRRPNVIVIVSDNQGFRDLGCFGSPDAITPNLDRLAAEGVKATTFYATSPACTPSRGSILTGRYPQRNGLFEMIRNEMVSYGHRYTMEEYAYSPEMTLGLDLRETTFGQLMQRAGYRTAVVGKWDSGRAKRFLPLQRGFDFFYGFANTGTDYWTGERYGIPSTFSGNALIKPEGFSEELFTREAVRFVRANRQQPFFLYLAYHAPAGSANLEKTGINPPKKYLDRYPELDPKSKRAEYLATISCMDDGVGEIMSALRELGLDRNTLVMFFPDNGAGGVADPTPFNAGGSQIDRMGEGGIRLSFIARWPGVLPAGRSTDEFLSILDVFPTLAAVGGARIPDGLTLDGFNLIPVLQGRERSPRQAMFWHSRNSKAARVGKYKWIESPTAKGLFDLTKDPGEKEDLSGQLPGVYADAKAHWESWRREMDAAEPRGPFRDY